MQRARERTVLGRQQRGHEHVPRAVLSVRINRVAMTDFSEPIKPRSLHWPVAFGWAPSAYGD